MSHKPLLQLNQFPHRTYDKIRYGDTDRQGHVNNVVFSEFLETGRLEIVYNPNKPLYKAGCQFVIVQNNLSLIKEIYWPGQVDIGTGITKIGSSSITFYQQLFQKGEVVASAETVIVQVDDITHMSNPLTEETIQALSQYLFKYHL